MTQPAPSLPEVDAAFTREALACAARAGLCAQALWAQIGGGAAGPEGVSFAQFGALWRAIAAQMGCEFFGLGARPMPVGSFAMLGHVMLHEPDLERAIRRGLALLGLILGTPSGRLEIRSGRAVIVLSDASCEAAHPHQAFAERSFWILLHALSCWLVRRRIPLLAVEFACPAPRESRAYGAFFGAPTRFGRAQSALSFDARHLRLPITRSAADLRGFLRASPANILTGYSHDAQILARITALLRAGDPGNWPDFPALAAALGLPATSLRRELRRQGTSYRELKDQLRQASAERMLRQGALTVTEVASALGYAEPSAFYRAFRKWRGITPDAFRAASRG